MAGQTLSMGGVAAREGSGVAYSEWVLFISQALNHAFTQVFPKMSHISTPPDPAC